MYTRARARSYIIYVCRARAPRLSYNITSSYSRHSAYIHVHTQTPGRVVSKDDWFLCVCASATRRPSQEIRMLKDYNNNVYNDNNDSNNNKKKSCVCVWVYVYLSEEQRDSCAGWVVAARDTEEEGSCSNREDRRRVRVQLARCSAPLRTYNIII